MSLKYTFDASSILHAWDEYPIGNFPKLWNWLGREIKRKNIIMLNDALEQSKKAPDCYKWLKKAGIHSDRVSQSILDFSLQITRKLGIMSGQYSTREGVDEKDILIISHAEYAKRVLVTEEGRQSMLPKKRKDYTIPAVCDLRGIPSCRFVQVIKQSGQVF